MPLPTFAPEIHTDRVILRGHRIEDFEPCLAMWSDPSTTRFIGGRPSTGEEVWSRMVRYAGLWQMLGFGYWAIFEKGTDRFVGEAGVADFRREMVPPSQGVPESGWVLARWARARGFASEAVRAVLRWSDQNLARGKTLCLISPDNAPSLKLAKQCGYVEVGTSLYKGEMSVRFERVDGAEMSSPR